MSRGGKKSSDDHGGVEDDVDWEIVTLHRFLPRSSWLFWYLYAFVSDFHNRIDLNIQWAPYDIVFVWQRNELCFPRTLEVQPYTDAIEGDSFWGDFLENGIVHFQALDAPPTGARHIVLLTWLTLSSACVLGWFDLTICRTGSTVAYRSDDNEHRLANENPLFGCFNNHDSAMIERAVTSTLHEFSASHRRSVMAF